MLKEDGKEDGRCWSYLPSELLEIIFQKLMLTDYLKCRQICRHWRNSVDDARKRCPPAPQFPLLLLLPPTSSSQNNSASVLDLTRDNTVNTIPTQDWEGQFDMVRSVEGWLVFHTYCPTETYDKMICAFFNPVSGEKYRFPPLSVLSTDFYPITCIFAKFTFSSTPDSPKFLAVALLSSQRENPMLQQLSYCKVSDTSWTLIETDQSSSSCFHEIAIVGTKLYAINAFKPDCLTVFNLRDLNAITSERLVMLDSKPARKVPGHVVNTYGIHYYSDLETSSLVRDSEQVLLVILNTNHVTNRSGKYLIDTKGFRIFKLDMSGPRWIEVHRLNDSLLLMDSAGIQLISAKNLDVPKGYMGGNCVFFCVNSTLDSLFVTTLRDLGVFSLENKEITRISLHPSLQNSGRCLWFSPRP